MIVIHKYFEELFSRLFHFFILHICNLTVLLFLKIVIWEFPGSPVVRTLCRGPRFNPGQGTKIPQAVRPHQEKKINKLWFNTDNIYHQNHFFSVQ